MLIAIKKVREISLFENFYFTTFSSFNHFKKYPLKIFLHIINLFTLIIKL